MSDLITVAALVRDTLTELADILDEELHTVPPDLSPWHFPIGTEEYPPTRWYAALLHDMTGKRNDGWKHTGIDLNVQDWPRGDIDRGEPVWAVTDGIVNGKGYSLSYLASVVILVEHDRCPLYVRYWHLANDATFKALKVGQRVSTGQCLGHLGDYRQGRGGDHLHFDMALDPFGPRWWFTHHQRVRWIDPVPVLKAHLDPAEVEASLRK